MFHVDKVGALRAASAAAVEPSPSRFLDVQDALAFLKRRAWTLCICILISLATAAAYIATAPKYYSSTARILLDNRNTQEFDPSRRGEAFDNFGIESQVELVSSENVLMPVFHKFNLDKDPEFLDPPRDLFSRGLRSATAAALKAVTGQPPREPDVRARTAVALDNFTANLQVRRVGLTSVLSVTYESLRPDRSAEIADAIADAYIREQIHARFAAAQRANSWMQVRLAQLREQALSASKAVQQFKSDNNIINTSRGLISDQQISEVTTQIVQARSQEDEAKARLDRVQAILKAGTLDATVTDALRIDVISRLRQQLLDATMKEQDISARFGPNHQVAMKSRDEVAQIRQSLQSELFRIGETFKSDYEIARSRRGSLDKTLADLISDQKGLNRAQVRLRELESMAQTYTALYENSLRRQTDMSDQQSFPLTEARIVSRGVSPLSSSRPRKPLIMAIALFGGGVIGLGLAFAREALDSAFRNPNHLEHQTGLRCIALAPDIGVNGRTARKNLARTKGSLDNLASGPLSYVTAAPFSAFAEGVRSMKVAVDLASDGRTCSIIGVTSSVPGEGKSTLSANLAHLIAGSGQQCLLIDADFRNPSLTRAALPHADFGLAEVISGQIGFDNAQLKHCVGGKLVFLPARNIKSKFDIIDILGSPGMKRLLQEMSAHFPYVIFDLPPMAPLVDVRAISPLLHKIMIVAQWGRTDRDLLRQAIDRNGPEHHAQILGVILNKIPPRALKRYPTYRSDTYLHF